MIAPGKTVSIPVRASDEPGVLAANFAKTYNLNKVGHIALKQILSRHIEEYK